METISYMSLFDELEKIAEEQQKDLTKAKFKRHLMASGAILAGAGLGAFGGSALQNAVLKHDKGRVATLIRRYPLATKAAPMVAGAAGGIAAGHAGLQALRTKRHLKFVEKGNDRPE